MLFASALQVLEVRSDLPLKSHRIPRFPGSLYQKQEERDKARKGWRAARWPETTNLSAKGVARLKKFAFPPVSQAGSHSSWFFLILLTRWMRRWKKLAEIRAGARTNTLSPFTSSRPNILPARIILFVLDPSTSLRVCFRGTSTRGHVCTCAFFFRAKAEAQKGWL